MEVKHTLGKCFIIDILQPTLCLKLRYHFCALTLSENVSFRQTDDLLELCFFRKASLVWAGYMEEGTLIYVCIQSRESSLEQWCLNEVRRWAGVCGMDEGVGMVCTQGSPRLEMSEGNSRIVLWKELVGELFIYKQIFIKYPWFAQLCSKHQKYLSKVRKYSCPYGTDMLEGGYRKHLIYIIQVLS